MESSFVCGKCQSFCEKTISFWALFCRVRSTLLFCSEVRYCQLALGTSPYELGGTTLGDSGWQGALYGHTGSSILAPWLRSARRPCTAPRSRIQTSRFFPISPSPTKAPTPPQQITSKGTQSAAAQASNNRRFRFTLFRFPEDDKLCEENCSSCSPNDNCYPHAKDVCLFFSHQKRFRSGTLPPRAQILQTYLAIDSNLAKPSPRLHNALRSTCPGSTGCTRPGPGITNLG